jgi:hypothetical protein
MSIESSSTDRTAPPRDVAPSRWYCSRALWAGLSIIAMWLAVLFASLFGGDFVSSSNANGFTKIPVVVFVLPFVLPATIAVARRGFTSASDEPPRAPEAAARARETPTTDPSALRAKPA